MPYRVGHFRGRNQQINMMDFTRAEARAGARGTRPPCPIAPLDPLLSECDLITQFYAAQQDLPLREFASYFNGRSRLNAPPCLTSHEKQKSYVYPMFPSANERTYQWYSHMDDALGCQNPADPEARCRCMQCTSTHCPGEAAARRNDFKSYIMTFRDQQTMTSIVNDVSCVICLGVGTLLDKKNIDASTERTKPVNEQPNYDTARCSPDKCSSILKRPNREGYRRPVRKKTLLLQGSPLPCLLECRDEAVRDTDPENCCFKSRDQSCEQSYDRLTIPERINVNTCKHGYHRCPDTDDEEEACHHHEPASMNRVMIYNEGISDDIANNLPLPSSTRKEPMSNSVVHHALSSAWHRSDMDNWIPYAHKTKSKYHRECKKEPTIRYRVASADHVDNHVCDNAHSSVKRVIHAKPTDNVPYYPCFSTPRKVLTSEKDIDEYISRNCNPNYPN